MNFKSQKLLLLFAFALIASFSLTSCGKNDCPDQKADFGDICDDANAETINDIIQMDCTCSGTGNQSTASGNITTNTTWTANTVNILDGRVIVTNGATLTIEPGAIIKAKQGTNTNASVLIIASDGKINAAGTATQPIIFTSEADNIQPGQIAGTNLTSSDDGLWGGVIILGKAPISPATGTTDRVEGIPADVAQAVYGGDEPTHNSGTFTYVSIRHGGVALEPDKEINGLTLGGVGSGTTIHHVEVVANLDDGIELFGGTVDINDAIVLFQGDDAFDIDQAYAGTIDNFIYIGDANSESGMEIDGPEGSENAAGAFTLQNGSLKGPGDFFARLKSDAQGTVKDTYFFDFDASSIIRLEGPVTYDNLTSNKLQVTDCEFNTTANLDDICVMRDGTTEQQTAVRTAFTGSNNTITSTPTKGATKAAFAAWSWADANGELAPF